ncbi:LamG domain-containing protein [Planctomycetota bacterium]
MKGCLLVVAAVFLVLPFGDMTRAEEGAFEYPCYLIDAFDADNSCWEGMDAEGNYRGPIRVIPERWLVGPPPSEKSGVTLPPDHWVDLQFRGRIVDGPENDIFLIELGPVSEQALIFITDGADQEYLLAKVTSGSIGDGVDPTEIGIDIVDINLPFEPCAVRILGLDNGGEAPGFDIANVRARISTDCGQTACWPIPVNGAGNMPTDVELSWFPGQSAQEHMVYFGDNPSDVDTDANAVSDPQQPQDANLFDPCGLDLGKTYYWRIDEVHDTQILPGPIWSFTTTDHHIVDDFDQYDLLAHDDPNNINFYDAWKQGSVYLSLDEAHECSKKSMGFDYYYYHYSVYSEASRPFSPAQDWTAAGEKVLELYFHGRSHNTPAQMYLVLDDGDSETILSYPGDANDLQKEAWQVWRIELSELNDPNLNLSHIAGLSLGFCAEAGKPSSTGSGTIYFDDIRLYSSRCLQENRSDADFDGDCIVDFKDLKELALCWLDRGTHMYYVTTPKNPIAWYKFDGNTDDSAGSADGRLLGTPTYTQGVFGQAISFDGYKDAVEITNVPGLFSKIVTGITIAFWQYGADSSHLSDTLCCSNYLYGLDDPVIAINLGCWRPPGRYNWDCGGPWSFENRLDGNHRYASEWSGRWNHWAFTKDVQTGTMQIFLNGLLYDSRTGADSPISGITSFEIGSGWYGGYDGLMDDFRIYNYALSQSEVAHVATNGTGIFEQPLMIPADLNEDDQIDFSDFAILADKWLDNKLWP